MDAFKAGGGNAALQELLKQRAGSATVFINANHPLNVKPEKAYTSEQIASARRVIESRGRKALAAQNAKKLGIGKGNYTYSGDKVFENGKLVGNMVGGRFVASPSSKKELSVEEKQAAVNAARRANQSANIPPEQGAPVDKTEPETPGAGAQETVAETQEAAETPPVPASEVVKPPSQRELLIKEARTKYKDSPFKQWAHANQKLAMALKPGQAGYAQVQEYLKERGKNGKLKVKPQEKPFIKTNTTNMKMGDGVTDLPGYSMSSSPIV